MWSENTVSNMNKQTDSNSDRSTNPNTAVIAASLRKRYAREKRFQWYGRLAVLTGFVFLFLLLADIVSKGTPAFTQSFIQLSINLDPEKLGVDAKSTADELRQANYDAVIKSSLRKKFPEVTGRKEKHQLYRLISAGAEYKLRDYVVNHPEAIGQTRKFWLRTHSEANSYLKGQVSMDTPESDRRVKNNQIGWLNQLKEAGLTDTRFNTTFFTAGDSREPELAGIKAALFGSFFTLSVTFLLAFPIGVFAAIYLQEFAPRNRFTDLIEININNLAAVPSIVYGLLGLAVFINFFGLPRSAPLVGGIVLALITLPTIIITSRTAIQAVSPSIREAALGIGASKLQTIFHHVLPVAMPGVLTGAIIGMAQALGESAPLLMIGMVAFIVDVPGGVTDPSTVLPIQVYLWSDNPEHGFIEKTSAAIMVLLGFLILMNALAIYLRKRFELK
ncbi:phosphate transport system permease protein PstA [bacterium BMS3Bbin11]|nr:phosphate transport system permease protein PstA [bacterium BMS3Abin11]GBE46316.1 phosphate transport system permease protein PstA [bacterium BMS3Bbin11]HDH07862.1 phosphate ABC transporter permease PstA [Gammaproteobacteria bacterium]HDH15029.1 phosphate ABC transporter permease PstA [Gammaproteobacteria bacterium]HDZ77770.1 phosphate ABC transporter permease PstA [Gammaproteobacteria bacterium]